MANNIQTRIRLRKDFLSSWVSVNPILADGELAIVLSENGNDNIKLGNGLSSFNDLPYLFQHSFETDKISTKEITAKSISQGYNVKSTPTSFATGIFTEADGNFGVVHGIEAKIISSDDYAFVFNGENLPGITERYTSHGEGTFNVNPLSGLNGFYIGEQSLSSIFSNYFLSSEIQNYYNKSQINGLWLDLDNKIIIVDNKLSDYYKKSETSSSQEIQSALDSKVKVGKYENNQYLLSSQDLSIVNIAADDYYKLVAEEKVDKNIVYILSSDHLNAHGQTIINVTNPILSGDAATKSYVDNSISEIDLSEYYKKTETSSAYQISSALKNVHGTSINIGQHGKNLSIVNSLSIINITRDDYYALPDSEKNLSGVQYIVSSDTYLNWPYQVSIDFLSSEYASQNTIVSCINDILSVFKHVNIDANQFLHLVTIPSLSSPVASQNDIVNTINTMLSAYKNQVGPIEIKGGDSSKVTIRTWND